MRTSRAGTVRRVRRKRIKPSLMLALLASSLVASLLTVTPFSGAIDLAEPVAAQAGVSTYCESIESGHPLGPDSAENQGGDPVNITVEVVDRENGTNLGGTADGFSYMVNLDNTAVGSDPEADRHPSVNPMASNAPTVAAGDEVYPTFTVPNGCRYLISVRAAGYKLWGQHVVLEGGAGADTSDRTVTIELLADAQDTGTPAEWRNNPDGSGFLEIPRDGLPLSDLEVWVFEDVGPTNGQPDVPLDNGLGGFQITIVDAAGETIVDFGGSPLCQDIGNDCITDSSGSLRLSGLPFGRYDIHAIPPDGTDWVQTTTFEGTQAVDAWLIEGDEGSGAIGEFLVEPNVQTAFWFGFVEHNPASLPTTCPTADCGTISGRAVNFMVTPPFEDSVPQPNEPIDIPYVALNATGGGDTVEQVVRGNANGEFTFENVPPGEYMLSIWDKPLDYITKFYTVSVPPNSDVEMGDLGVWRWFGWFSGYIYLDNGVAADGTVLDSGNTLSQMNLNGLPDDTFAGNGLRDCYGGAAADPHDIPTCEAGLPMEEVLLKYRDGSVYKTAITDGNGYYEFPEVRGPLGRYVVPEVGFARRDRTGHSIREEFNFDEGGDPPYEPYKSLPIPGEKGGNLLLAAIIWEGHRTSVDWGKANYDLTDPEQNGGIAGAVLYGTTRNELEPQLAGQEGYEPGIPNVPLRLWGPGADGIPNTDLDVLMVELTTDAWEHPGDGDGPQPQTAWTNGPDTPCNLIDNLGNPVDDPNGIAAGCMEIPQNGNETQDGAWDGGFAFEDDCSAAITTQQGAVLRGDPADPGSNYNAAPGTLYDEGTLGDCTHIVSGDYAAQVLVPEFYQILKEEDVNTDEGVELVPQIPPTGCVGLDHEVPDPRSPSYGVAEPLCDLKVIHLQPGQNAAVEFTLFTECPAPEGPTGGGCDPDDPYTSPGGRTSPDITQRWSTDYEGPDDESVPLPARFFGLMENDVAIQNDPNSLVYGEKFGLAGIPIGLYDFTGEKLTTIYTDENGYYEALVPSTYTALCPTPSGVCPGMYWFILNDPGDPAAPDEGYNPNYLTETLNFETFPGKMRHTDTPLDPTTAIQCVIEQGTPELLHISDTHKFPGGTLDVTITGNAFENGPTGAPNVHLVPPGGGAIIPLSVVTWTPSDVTGPTPVFEDVVTVTVPDLPVGRYQMEIEADGFTSANAITFHVLAGGTTVIPVIPTTDLDLGIVQPIQAAINSASPGDFIDVAPGTYRENLVIGVDGIVIQGHGPGGAVGNTIPEAGDDAAFPPSDPPFSTITGSNIDSRFFFGSGPAQTLWESTVPGAYSGAPAGAAATLFGANDVMIDGMGIGFSRGLGAGGVWAYRDSSGMKVSNNIIAHNTGRHGGGVVVGAPGAEGGLADNGNDGAAIENNRIIQNGGTFFAGAVGLFAGSDGYRIAHNDICGNFSVEYGAGISHFGTSPGGRITQNHIYYNEAFDEGGGIMIAGESRTGPTHTPSGDVTIDKNEILFNLSNDDGGGIRLLAPRDSRIEIVNNFINHNVAGDHGGGLALDDASDVFIVNNTIVENASTSTSEDAEKAVALSSCAPVFTDQITCPRGAGLTTTPHSANFSPADGSTFSDPVLVNNIFWRNTSYYWGLLPPELGVPEGQFGLVPAGGPPGGGQSGYWDMEVVFGGAAGCFDPTYSFLSVASGPYDLCDYSAATGNVVGVDPLVNTDWAVKEANLVILCAPGILGDVIQCRISRGEDGPLGIGGTVFLDLIDMHLMPVSPAIDAGIDPSTLINPITVDDDFDVEARPMGATWDIGADEVLADDPDVYISTDCGSYGNAASCGDPALGDGRSDVRIMRVNGTSLEIVFEGWEVMTKTGNQSRRDPAEAQIDGFAFLSETEILVSFNRPMHYSVFGMAPPPDVNIDDADILLFTATSLGAGTATTGTWSFYFDASDVGMDAGSEDVDAIALAPGGGLLLSTVGGASVGGGQTYDDSDVFKFEFTTGPGEVTDGNFEAFFDGSQSEGPNGSDLATNAEDINGFSTDPLSADLLHLTTPGNISVAEAVDPYIAADHDVTTCVNEAGPQVCDDWVVLFDGNTVPGLGQFDIKGLEVYVGGLG
ncbi:MAG: hypothetical protein GY724_07840 [Actinomycetia bacterium]|nr:hypothetical protein [Actinomycetes bacterium]